MRQYESYACDKCENVIEVQNVGGGTLSCCNQDMKNTTKSLTQINLLKAFAGESQARNKYEYFAKIAQKESFRDIATHFQRAADNEKMHAKLELKLYNKLSVGDEFGDTLKNLHIAADGENYENRTMYPDFVKIAKEEGENEAAKLFEGIGKVEVEHENMYKELISRLTNNQEHESVNEDEEWLCEVCGHIHRGKKALKVCPLCKHSQDYQSRLNSKK